MQPWEQVPRVVRACGDPFALDGGAPLRRFVTAAEARGFAVGLWLGRPRGEADGEGRGVPLSDGAVDCSVRTRVDCDELLPVYRAIDRSVAATAPLVVFGDGDDVRRAALEWSLACAVFVGSAPVVPVSGDVGGPVERWDAVEALLRRCAEVQAPGVWELPEGALPAVELAAWSGIGEPTGGPWLHPCGIDAGWGTGELLDALGELRPGGGGPAVRLHWLDRSPPPRQLVDRVAAIGSEWGDGTLTAAAVGGCAGWLLPWGRMMGRQLLLRALASGRPVLATRAGPTAEVLAADGVCIPVAGWHRRGGGFAIDRASLVHGLRQAGGAGELGSVARRARAHVGTWHGPRPRPVAAVAWRGDGRPRLVLEAPLLETSSTSELTIETARALIARGRVAVDLVLRTPGAGDLQVLRRRAPELLDFLVRRPGPCDLWLSAGWPPRLGRPQARAHAVRVDWEYGGLPVHMMGALEGADRIVVHSRAVAAAMAAAGMPDEKVVRLAHGVGAEFAPAGPPHPQVAAFRAGAGPGTVAVLFVGGLVWRKGIDLWLRTLLALHGRGVRVCGVIKSIGAASHYAGFHLEELVRRVMANPCAPPILHLDRSMDRAELAQLYRACDVMVHPYRGEGFGMPVLEAMACGLPVVVTAGGATDDFCNGVPSALQVASTRRPCDPAEPHIGGAWVLEPDPDDLLRQVEAVATRAPHWRALALPTATLPTWDQAAETLETLMLHLQSGQLSSPDVTDGGGLARRTAPLSEVLERST